MKVKNLAQLKSMVERSGMALDEDGKVAPAPAPVAQPAPSNDELLAAIGRLTQATEEASAARAARVVVREPAQEKPVLKWKFTVHRGEDGFTSEVIAEAMFPADTH